MDLPLLDPSNLRWSSSSFLIPTTCSSKVPNEPTNPPMLLTRAAKRSPETTSQALEKSTKKELSRILRTEAAIKAIERKANSNKYNNLWPKAVLEALDDAIRQNRWESALKIFKLLRKQHWYKPKGQTYKKLLVMLGKCGQPNQSRFLFEIMQSDGLQPNVDLYTALVNVYGLNGLFDDAFHTIDEMKSVCDCKPDVYTYSILIKCCTKLHRFDMISQILTEMSYLGIECSTVTYNTIIDGYGKAKLFDLMENSLTDMIKSGLFVPDIFTFNSVIGAYGNSGKIQEMEKWFNEFQLMGLEADVRTYNILIKSYGKLGLYEKMESVMDFMKKRYFSPTVVTFNIIIEIFGKAGEIEKMGDFFLRMKHQGMKPNSITYCSLVSAYGKFGYLGKVESIMTQVANSDVVLDTVFFNCVISAYGQAGEIKSMEETFLAMNERKCEPDHITFATMIQAYKAKGMNEAAEELERKVIASTGNSGRKLIAC